MSEKKLWGGRFKKGLHPDAISLSYSLQTDKRLATHDIDVNLAHAKALHKAGILTAEELKKLTTCLQALKKRFEAGDNSLFADDEDIHSCIERLVTKELGDLGKKLHTGKSRNDQVITDTRLFVKAETLTVQRHLEELLNAFFHKAEETAGVIFPGFTHMQTAQPVLLAHHFLAYFEQFRRDLNRFRQTYVTADVCTLGSGALAGNNYGLDRELVARELGFGALSRNSMDAVSDRDFILEFLSAASICMTHLSRLSEELVLWSSPMVGFITIGDEFTTGSSIMPQKKNPDIAELIRGKAGRVLGHLVSLQHTIKGLTLTYNRDLQEDKPLLFDTADTLNLALKNMAHMLYTVTINEARVTQALKQGFICATEFADYLVRKGVPFRESHEITGKVVLYAEENNKELDTLTLAEFKAICDKVENDVYDHLTLEAAVNAKNVPGGTASGQVNHQLKLIREEFKW